MQRKLSGDEGNSENAGFRPTVADNLDSREASTPQPFIPTLRPIDNTIPPSLTTKSRPTTLNQDIDNQPEEEEDEGEESANQPLKTTNRRFNKISRERTRQRVSRPRSRDPTTTGASNTSNRNTINSNRFRLRNPSLNRAREPVTTVRPTTTTTTPPPLTTTLTTTTAETSSLRDEPRRLDGFPVNILDAFAPADQIRPTTRQGTNSLPVFLSKEQQLFQQIQQQQQVEDTTTSNQQTNTRQQITSDVSPSRSRGQSRPEPQSQPRLRQQQPRKPTNSNRRLPSASPEGSDTGEVQLVRQIHRGPTKPEPLKPFQVIPAATPPAPSGLAGRTRSRLPISPAENNEDEYEFEYEYYYDYLDGEGALGASQSADRGTDYDLVPLSNKVRILADGSPNCLDVGVFPHPFSCKQFVNCFRNPGTGIVGSIYKCPSYLAFDPVGARCNWVTEIVCGTSK